MNAPTRKYSIEIRAGADDLPSLCGEIRYILERIQEGSVEGVGGGSSAGSHFKITVDPEMTHEKYFELNDQYLAATK
jgi:hypothetical protein